MLNLLSSTRPEWTQMALENLDAILLDHIHCEKKAASTAMSLISRYPGRSGLVEKMCALAIEEMGHFQLVHEIARKRGLELSRDTADEYVQHLLQHVRKQEPEKLLDSLLVAALIEARSCERFVLLADALPPSGIKDLYRSLVQSEAGHYTLFTSLARLYFDAEIVRNRFDELAKIECEYVLHAPLQRRVHG